MSTTEPQATQCFVCSKHQGHIAIPGGAIYEDELVYASHARNDSGSGYLGYLFAEPKRHAPGLADLTDEEAQALGLLVTRLSRALKVSKGAEHVYAFVLGDHVPHLHIHIVPRYPGTPREYWGSDVSEWPDAPSGDSLQIAALCDRLHASLLSER